MFEGSRTKIARAVRAGPAGPASSRAYVSLVTFFAPKKVTNHHVPTFVWRQRKYECRGL